MLKVVETKKYQKGLIKIRHKKTVLKELRKALEILVNQKPIPKSYKDHELQGKMKGIRELHLAHDDLLLYFIETELGELVLVDIGTHSRTLKI